MTDNPRHIATGARSCRTILHSGQRESSLVRTHRPQALSISLAKSAPLANATSVSFVFLKNGPLPRLLLQDWANAFEDFADNAALGEALELAISVDTAVAHLTYSLGEPRSPLNCFDTYWRWLEV